MEEVFKMAKTINGDIKNLEQATQVILEKQHKDYINTFVSFMDSIRKELTSKLEEMEKYSEEK
jgi:flagellar motor component MotA